MKTHSDTLDKPAQTHTGTYTPPNNDAHSGGLTWEEGWKESQFGVLRSKANSTNTTNQSRLALSTREMALVQTFILTQNVFISVLPSPTYSSILSVKLFLESPIYPGGC